MTIAARGVDRTAMTHHFNGKIDRPRTATRALDRTERDALGGPEAPAALARVIAGFWDFARETPTDRIIDLSEHRRDGVLVNLPARAMTGFNWGGDVGDWRFAPAQYGAIHFHDDDLHDAGWETDFRLDTGPELASGVYAARLRVPGTIPEHVVFFVRPPPGERRAEVCYLAPTATYLAYGNYRVMDCGPANEEFQSTHLMVGGTENRNVRSDMVFFEMDGGGAVFSTGSIIWIASLAWNDCDNNVSRITKNVLDRFLDPRPFPTPSG